MATVGLIARIVLAAVLTIASVAKLRDRRQTSQMLTLAGIPGPLAPVAAAGLSLVELILAAGLLVPDSARAASAGTVALMATFTAALAIARARGRELECRCFGGVRPRPVTTHTLVRNAVLAALALLAAATPERNGLPHLGTATPGELIAFAALITMVLFNVALLRQHGRILVRVEALEADHPAPSATDQPATVAAPVPPLVLERLDGGHATLGAFTPGSQQQVLLVFTDPGCGPCQVLVPELVEWQSRAGSDLAIVPVARADANTGRAAYSSLGLAHILLDPYGQAAKICGADRFPTGILTTADGRVAHPPVVGVEAIIGLLNSLVQDRHDSDTTDAHHTARPAPIVAPA